MDTSEIKILLDKYYNGETSLEEERFLKEYFSSGKADEALAEHIPFFAALRKERDIVPGAGLENKILEKLNDATVIPFYEKRTFWVYFSGVAASILFIFTLIFEMQFTNTNKGSLADNTWSEQETQIAYNQTKAALAYVSEKYTRATEPLGEVAKFGNSAMAVNQLGKFGNELNNVNEQVDKIDRGVNNLRNLSKFSIIVEP